MTGVDRTDSVDKSLDLRARAREGLRREIGEVALRLFVERGFDDVTAAELAHVSGISLRSFFRYFATKEDAALAGLERSMQLVASTFASRPADEGVWASLQYAFASVVDVAGLEGPDPLDVSRLFVETPSLRARRLEKHGEWRRTLLPLLAERLPDQDEPWRGETACLAILTAALGCLDTATEMWVRDEGRVSATTVLAQAFDAVSAVR